MDHAENAPTLPADLLSAVLLIFVDVRTVGRFACTLRLNSSAAKQGALWYELYRRWWQQTRSLLKEVVPQLPAPTTCHHDQAVDWRSLYEQRMLSLVPLAVTDAVRVFDGELRSDSDGNEMPVKAVLGWKKGRIGGHALIGHVRSLWMGMCGPGRGASKWQVQWEDKSRANKWSFSGELDLDGMSVTGKYHLSAKETGTFRLRTQPTATAPTFKELALTILQFAA
mmetsp:Transcript_16139/g.37077  ORF Transcript_16139/g.37077 Transcript_16139/m.37077 type:complete len:225 (-) Transcript_16139:100-774(-)